MSTAPHRAPVRSLVRSALHAPHGRLGEAARLAMREGVSLGRVALVDRLTGVFEDVAEARVGAAGLLLLLFLEEGRGSSALHLGAPPSFDELEATFPDDWPLAREELVTGLGAWQEAEESLPPHRRLLGPPAACRPFVLEGQALYSNWLYAAEGRVAEGLAGLIRSPSPADVDDDALSSALQGVLGQAPELGPSGPLRLAADQLLAVARAPTSRLVVMTGGPGTGKTSVIGALLRLFAALGIAPADLLLASPTGRAAQRLSESVLHSLRRIQHPLPSDEELLKAPPAGSTLHRLLGWTPKHHTFKVGEGSPLPGRLLVVDEVSMVDLEMMTQLLAALPADCPHTLLLVGDPDQLPSVGTGDVLGQLASADPGLAPGERQRLERRTRALTDVLSSPEPHEDLDARLDELSEEEGPSRVHVRLTHTYRQAATHGGNRIRDLAQAIEALDSPEAAQRLCEGGLAPRRVAAADGVAFDDVVLVEDPAQLNPLLDRWFTHQVEPVLHAARNEDVRHGQAASTAALSEALARAGRSRVLCFNHQGPWGEERINRSWLRRAGSPGEALVAGVPVMVTQNSYDVQLFNGDQGLVIDVEDEEGTRREVAFPSLDGPRRVPLGHLPPHRPAFAMTVHKSQGSEHDHVLILLPPRSRLLRKETLYTAITRAKKSVTLVGRREVLAEGLGTPMRRRSRLRERIAGRLR